METTTITIGTNTIDYEPAGGKAERTVKKLAEEYAKRLGSFRASNPAKTYGKEVEDHE